jgi:subtilisin family serine protease
LIVRLVSLALLGAISAAAVELRARHVPNDPLFAAQWPLENTGQGGGSAGADVDAPEAWSYTRGSPDVVIAVLDDGVDLDHPDLAPNMLSSGRDFTADPPGSDARPKASADRHGTAVAGIAAARGGNGLGISGICPLCKILPVRVYGTSNLGTAAAFRYAIEQGADVIVNAWGYAHALPLGADDVVRDAIETAAREGRDGRGALIVFGVTNESVDNCTGPSADIASLPSVVAVGVANHNDELGGSGFGPCLDLVAPAKPQDRSTIGVPTTDRTGMAGHTEGDYYTGFGGTSAAAPLVAGVAGLLLALNPTLTREDLQRLLTSTADKIDPEHAAYDATGFSERAGYGRVNAARALVPNVHIRVAPERVRTGEGFSITVTASAPLGLDFVEWSALDSGVSRLDSVHRRALRGEAVHSATWDGLAIDRPGTFTFRADACDVRLATPVPGYPHCASEGATARATVQVVEQADGLPR